MNSKTIKLFRLSYHIALSVMTVVSGFLLMAACLQIYQSGGEQIYTPEKVAAAFAPIALPIYITLGLIAGSVLISILLPAEAKRLPTEKQYALLLRRAYERADMQHCNEEILAAIAKEQKKRRLALGLSLAVWIIGGCIFVPYACNGNNYSSELHLATDSIVAIVRWLIPCTLIPTICSIFAVYYGHGSIRRELDLVKLAPKAVNKAPSLPDKKEKALLYARLGILVIALGFVIGGFIAGGTADVLAKAVAICTECVGLG